MISIKDLKLNKNGIDILNNITFNIEENSITCILGNKNSGKSAILKSISGIYQNYYGEILIDNEDIKYIKDIVVDMLHQNREYDSEITVNDYLKFYGSIYNKSDKNMLQKQIDEYLIKFSLISYKYTNINMLDDYDYKFVELIRILINDSKIILFDNLFSLNDEEFNEKLIEFIKTLIGKKTLVFTSRSLNYIEEIATHIGIIDNGNLVIFGDKESVYQSAEINKKVQVDIIEGQDIALSVLKDNKYVNDIIYNDNTISFTLARDSSKSNKRMELESEILNSLIENGVKVYSFKRHRAKFEQLFERLLG